MRIRLLLAVLALVVAACGDAPGPVQLSYALEPGTSFQYEVELEQAIDLTSTGDTAAFGEGEEMPGEMSIVISGTTVLAHTVADGPEPGTYSINITGEFSELEISGTIDDEPVDHSDVADMAEMGPIDVTVVVDEQGRVIPDDTFGRGADFLGGLGLFDLLEQVGNGPGQFLGPPLPEGEVTVGDSWTDTIEIPGMLGEDAITTRIHSEVVDTDSLDGNDVFVIETVSTTSAIDVDLAEMLMGFFSAFIPEGGDDMGDIDALVSQLRFAFSVDETVADFTTWFDYEAGRARQGGVASSTRIALDVAVPDELTGDLVEFAVEIALEQGVTYRLVGSDDG